MSNKQQKKTKTEAHMFLKKLPQAPKMGMINPAENHSTGEGMVNNLS